MTGFEIFLVIIVWVFFMAAADEYWARYQHKKKKRAWQKFYMEQGHRRQCSDE